MSHNMEKSLANIEKSLSATAGSAGKGNKALVGLAQSLNALIDAVGSKTFNAKQANNILDFSRGLVIVANSVNPSAGKSFAKFADGMSTAFDILIDVMNPVKLLKLHLASKLLFEGKNPMLARIITGMHDVFKDLDVRSAKEGAEALNIMGEGILSLTKAFKSFILIGIAAPIIAIGALVVRGLIGLFMALGKKANDIEAGGNALKSLGKGLIIFSAGLASMILVTAIAGPSIIEAIGIIALFSLTFFILGKGHKDIVKGSESVALMGLAIFGFSMALAAIALVMMIADPLALLGGIAILIGFALVFNLLGQNVKNIAEGAIILVLGIAVGLFIFSAALVILAEAMKLWTLENAFLATGLIMGLGFAIGFIGRQPGIERGSKVLIEMGIGLIAIAAGILSFGVALKLLQMLNIDGGLIMAGAVMSAVLFGLGAAISFIGIQPGITTGTAALVEMGIGLIAVAGGILAFGVAIKLLQMLNFDGGLIAAGGIMAAVLVGLATAFGVIGAIGAGPIGAGAGAMGLVGVSLILISAGILVFALAIKALQAIFKKDLLKAGEIAGGILLGLGLAFAGIGVLAAPIVFGAAAVLSIGASLLIFSVGLLVFGASLSYLNSKNLLEKNKDGDYTLKGSSMLWDLSTQFSKIGLQAINPLFWLGIGSSVAMGAALFTIGTGLSVAADALAKIKNMDKIITPLFGDKGLIPAIASSFSKIGEEYGGFLGIASFLGTDNVSKGVRVTKGFGDVLQELAGGIAAFADFQNFPVKIVKNGKLVYDTVDIFSDVLPQIQTNLLGDGPTSKAPGLLYSLASVFAEIGRKFGSSFLSESLTAKGVGAVKGLGGVLQELAGGITAFANFEKFPVQIEENGKLVYTSINIFKDVLPKIQTNLIGDGTVNSKNPGILLGLASIFATIGEKYGESMFMDGDTKKGVDAVKGIGSVLSELVGGIVAFANLERGLPNFDKNGKLNAANPYTKFNMGAVRAYITSIINTIPNIFATIDVDKLEAAQEKADLVEPLAKSIASIGKSLSKLNFDKGADSINMMNLIGPAIKKFADDTSSIDLSDDKIAKLKNLSTVFEKFSKIGSGLNAFASALSATGRSFETFGKGFSTFSSQLDKFVRFENSFSNLVKNQNKYKFDQFAKSVGTLKNNVNDFNVENLKLTDSLMKSLAVLSKSPDALGAQIKDSLEEAMNQLATALHEMAKSQSGATEQNQDFISKIGATFGTPAPASNPFIGKPAAAKGSMGPVTPAPEDNSVMISAALNDLKKSVDLLSGKFTAGAHGAIKVEMG